jgi:hypothetical protein
LEPDKPVCRLNPDYIAGLAGLVAKQVILLFAGSNFAGTQIDYVSFFKENIIGKPLQVFVSCPVLDVLAGASLPLPG